METIKKYIPEFFACPVCGTENSTGLLVKSEMTYNQLVTETGKEHPLQNPTFFGMKSLMCHGCGFVMQFHVPPGHELSPQADS